MSEARENNFETLLTITLKQQKIIEQLEQQITDLKESQKQKQIIKLCERLDKAERQNKQMISKLINIYTILFTESYDSIIQSELRLFIESITGKKIEEAIK